MLSVLVFLRKGLVGFFCHLVPQGSPLVLGPFLFWVECVSRAIRPLTLVLRLCANMLAGHVIMSVFSGIFVWLVFSSFFSCFFS